MKNPDPNFHIDSDLDPHPDWHQNDANPHADSTPSFTIILRNASLQSFFFISGKGAIILSMEWKAC